MKSLKALFLLVLFLGLVCVVAGLIVLSHHEGVEAQPPKPAQAGPQPAVSHARTSEMTPLTDAPVITTLPAANRQHPASAKPNGPAKSNNSGTSATANTGAPAKGALKDPAARVALAWVGVDPAAEAYWYEAINDPNLPPNERKDLIEDLNEDGLSDPKHPTVDDLPLIVSRLFLIEAARPEAMDQVNADAFQEAYKDLVNLANLAMGGGEPVR